MKILQRILIKYLAHFIIQSIDNLQLPRQNKRYLNSAPKFTSSLQSLQVFEWDSISYNLPSVYDPDGNNYSISVTMARDGSSLPSWINFNQNKLIVSPPKGIDESKAILLRNNLL